VFAVVVVGPPGSGKTSVLTALHDLLADSDVAHAVIEAEAVAWAHPPAGDEQTFRHLESLCRMYDEAGCELILVGATATSGDYMARLFAAVRAADHLVVRLEANPSTLRERIVDREPPEWSGLRHLVDATEQIARASSSLEGVDLVCSTEDSSAVAVADRIQRARPKILGARERGGFSQGFFDFGR
jgi:shikimate kinase